ncbi:MAG: GNAT family N-acetyltransferase [Alphaproteobacteria bacterium]|nr:GNAT family N-acetyltransferase [Alphaproteobacteria bacterium]
MHDIYHKETNEPFFIQPVTKKYVEPFYDLIQEQAEHHSFVSHSSREAEIRKLFEAVQRKDLQAFLVADRETDKSLCAVTFVDCWTAHGPGVYLEDIVTTKKQRGKGIGHFAMAALAQITLCKGYSYLAWECAANNLVAHRFYDSFGCERHDDLLTWRFKGPFAEPKDKESIVQLFSENAASVCLPEYDCGLNPANPNMVVLVAVDKAGTPIAKSIAYRSYSTFRLVSGMHVETFVPNGCGKETAAAMLEKQIQIQAAKGWTGHTDITISKDSKKSLVPVIRELGFEPLSYGDDRMVPRCLCGEALEAAAKSKPNLIESFMESQNALTVHNHSFTLATRTQEEKKDNDSLLLSPSL